MFCLATPSALVDQQDASEKGPSPKGSRPVDGLCRAIRDVKVDPRLKSDGIRFCEDCQLERVRVLGRRAEVVQWRKR